MEPPVHERAESTKMVPVYKVAVIQMHPKVHTHVIISIFDLG